jgi:TrmH family RNA methyltransferase
MLSENQAKIIRSLSLKKYRYKYNLFLAEGAKTVFDILRSGFKEVHQIFISRAPDDPDSALLMPFKERVIKVTDREMSRISNLDSIPEILMTGSIPPPMFPERSDFENGIHLYLDQVQDPGNLGTILRTAEWFAVRSIGFSEGCADIVHPKVIQASMGSFSRVKYWNGTLTALSLNDHLPVIGAALEGEPLYEKFLPDSGLLVIGSEGKGISEQVRTRLTCTVRIPAYQALPESLNAAMATGIILAEWQRQLHTRKDKVQPIA